MRADAGDFRTAPTRRRGNIDDHPTLFGEVLPGVFCGVEQQVHFVANREVPILDGHFADRREARGRRIVIEHIDSPVLVDRCINPGLGLFVIAEIDRRITVEPQPFGVQQGGGFFMGGGLRIAADDNCTLSGKAQRGSTALAAAGASNQYNLVLQTTCHAVLPMSLDD